MNDALILRLGRDALLTAVMVGGPILGASLLIGLTVSLLQAATQVSEPTLTFVPKLIGVLLVVAVFGPWMTHQIVDFARRMLELLPTITQ